MCILVCMLLIYSFCKVASCVTSTPKHNYSTDEETASATTQTTSSKWTATNSRQKRNKTNSATKQCKVSDNNNKVHKQRPPTAPLMVHHLLDSV